MNDFEVYVFTTTDFGQSLQADFQRHPAGITERATCHPRAPSQPESALSSAPKRRLHVSFDRGANWQPLKLNLPTVPVSDIAIHPRENDLILGHARPFDLDPRRHHSARTDWTAGSWPATCTSSTSGRPRLADLRQPERSRRARPQIFHRRKSAVRGHPELLPEGKHPARKTRVIISVEDRNGKEDPRVRGHRKRPASTEWPGTSAPAPRS